jgi:hypothetical protein
MTPALILRDAFWGLSTVLEIVLATMVIRRRLYHSHPFFFAYILATIVQSALFAVSCYYFGQGSRVSFYVGWGTQAVVICGRWFAVMEIAKRVLGQYLGIWALAGRILILLGLSVLAYAIFSSGSRWKLIVLNADRAAELCIATLIVAILLFVRYYRVPMGNLERMLAIGFCLYSCFVVINDSIYENWRHTFADLWNYLDMLTFTASLLLWITAVRTADVQQASASPVALAPELYADLSRKLNSRLLLLNNRLNHLFRSEDSRP